MPLKLQFDAHFLIVYISFNQVLLEVYHPVLQTGAHDFEVLRKIVIYLLLRDLRRWAFARQGSIL